MDGSMMMWWAWHGGTHSVSTRTSGGYRQVSQRNSYAGMYGASSFRGRIGSRFGSIYYGRSYLSGCAFSFSGEPP